MTLHTLLLVLHVIIGAAMIGLILVQRGKGAETGAAFGSGASATVFGAKGSANFLSRSTAVLATLFFVTSLTLAYLGAERPEIKSVIEQTEAPAPAAQPVTGDDSAASMPVPTVPETPAPGGAPAPAP